VALDIDSANELPRPSHQSGLSVTDGTRRSEACGGTT